MIHCTKCGTENRDDAKFCIKCGAQLYVTGASQQYRRVENECFGIPHGGLVAGIVIGVIILLFGIAAVVTQITKIDYSAWVGAFVPIIIGILIIIGVIFGMQRRKY